MRHIGLIAERTSAGRTIAGDSGVRLVETLRLIASKGGGTMTTCGCTHLDAGSAAHWSLLKLNPQKQRGYVESLHEYFPGIESYYPIYTKLSRPHGSRRPMRVERPVYPGYLFLKVREGDDWQAPVSLPVRARWVKFGGIVESIPDRVVQGLRKLEEAGELVREVKYVNPYVAGAQVRVHLPMQDLLAVIVRLVGKNRALVEMPLGRATVHLHRLQVLGH